MASNKYGLRSLKKDFPTEDKCLDFIFKSLHTKECSCGGTYKRKPGRKQYQCSKCRHQIAPLAGTIFHKSDTPLTMWFHALLVFSNAKSGVSAKYLQRELEVTYKTAWRMLNLIRRALKQNDKYLKGDVEMDAGYFGGKGKGGKYNKNQSKVMQDKSLVMAAVQRGGEMRADVMPNQSAKSHEVFLYRHVALKSRLLTDKTNKLDNVAYGYDRHAVDHHKGEYARGDVHVNRIESFWAHVKRSIKGTHKVVSKKYLQSYLNGFVFHYNNRHSDSERFASLLGTILLGAR